VTQELALFLPMPPEASRIDTTPLKPEFLLEILIAQKVSMELKTAQCPWLSKRPLSPSEALESPCFYR